MRVEWLYFDGCPTYRTAEKTLRAVFAQGGAEAVVELVAVNTDEGVRARLQDVRYPGGADGFAHGGDGAGVVGRAQPCTNCVVISGKIKGAGEGGPA